MSERTDRLRASVEAVVAGRITEEQGNIYQYAENAEYHVTSRDLTLRGRADIEQLLRSMGGNVSLGLREMVEHGDFVLATADLENRISGIEYKGPGAVVWRFNDNDEIIEQWTFRGGGTGSPG